MKKRNFALPIFALPILIFLLCFSFVACGEKDTPTTSSADIYAQATHIQLSDEKITVEGTDISDNSEDAVYAAKDIVFYLEGQDFTYGEGTAEDAHSQAEADEHTVVHITQPGTYHITGTLSKGQIAVDLGEDAIENPDAKVTLILDNMDITCTVAPAVIFYNVYECGSSDAETATATVDTGEAGANVIIADGSTNVVRGSYVARIYKSYELNEAGTEVVDSKKLHKYDGAFYSKQSMNIDGGEEGTGILSIIADNEGLGTELHLTINGGWIIIDSGNDGINTNEDYVSVTTINDGKLHIHVNGSTGEGDGIDSNGWLNINGGEVIAEACGASADSGIDSDMGISINGGTVIATGNMLDAITTNNQNAVVFNFDQAQVNGDGTGAGYSLEDTNGDRQLNFEARNNFSILFYSSPDLAAGEYTLWKNTTQLSGIATAQGSMQGGRPMGERPEMPEGLTPGEAPEMPEGFTPGEAPEMPEGFTPGEAPEMPEGFTPDKRPDGAQNMGGRGGMGNPFRGSMSTEDASPAFVIQEGTNHFYVLSDVDAETTIAN